MTYPTRLLSLCLLPSTSERNCFSSCLVTANGYWKASSHDFRVVGSGKFCDIITDREDHFASQPTRTYRLRLLAISQGVSPRQDRKQARDMSWWSRQACNAKVCTYVSDIGATCRRIAGVPISLAPVLICFAAPSTSCLFSL